MCLGGRNKARRLLPMLVPYRCYTWKDRVLDRPRRSAQNTQDRLLLKPIEPVLADTMPLPLTPTLTPTLTLIIGMSES